MYQILDLGVAISVQATVNQERTFKDKEHTHKHMKASEITAFIMHCSINECMTLNILFSRLEEGRMVFSPSPVPAWAVMAN